MQATAQISFGGGAQIRRNHARGVGSPPLGRLGALISSNGFVGGSFPEPTVARRPAPARPGLAGSP